jgi:hypothetical protein
MVKNPQSRERETGRLLLPPVFPSPVAAGTTAASMGFAREE